MIDNALRSYLHFTTNFKEEYLQSEHDVARCIQKLLRSHLFQGNQEYVRIQLIYCLLQEDEPATLHFLAGFLLLDGRQNEATFEKMNEEGCFPRLVELIQHEKINDASIHRLMLELVYEMSRIQRLSYEDLGSVDDAFVTFLFQIVEQVSGDVDDPYHYPIIRVLVSLQSGMLFLCSSAKLLG